MILIRTFILLGLCFLPSLSSAQQTHSTISSNTTTNTVTSTMAPAAPSAVGMVSTAEGLVSLDFQDADIKNVLKILAYKSGVNIVAGPEVTGAVTIQLNNVAWQKALEVLLSTYGYGYERNGNIVIVTTMENLKKRHEDAVLIAQQEPLSTKTYVLNFAKASDLIDSLSKLKTSRGQVNFDQRTNSIIVRDVQSNMELMEEVMKTLDSPTPQVVIEARVIETDLNNKENLGIDWVAQVSAKGSKRPTIFPFTPRASKPYIPDIIPADSTTTDFTYGFLDFTKLSATLELLSSRSNTHIISNPKIVTLDNQTAKIVVGSQYPLPQYTYNTDQAKLQVSGWSYLDIGIIFEVTPHVNNAGLVTLDLNPKITAILDYVTVETTQVPRLSTEEAKTKVMIKDGQTLVIAGLISDQTTLSKNQIPFLGDIPVLGQVFRKNNNSVTKTELLIFLTPHIITAKSEVAAVAAESGR